jgi:hypothetical protein
MSVCCEQRRQSRGSSTDNNYTRASKAQYHLLRHGMEVTGHAF